MNGRLSLWQRFVAWLRGERVSRLSSRSRLSPRAQLALPAASGQDSLSGTLRDPAGGSTGGFPRPEEELWLESLIAEVSEGKRLSAVASDGFWSRIDGLWDDGHERLACEWLGKFLVVPEVPAKSVYEVRKRLIELCDRRGDLATAEPHLQAIVRAWAEWEGREERPSGHLREQLEDRVEDRVPKRIAERATKAKDKEADTDADADNHNDNNGDKHDHGAASAESGAAPDALVKAQPRRGRRPESIDGDSSIDEREESQIRPLGEEADLLRAHYLLGEFYRRQGDESQALRHYESILARDMNYPNARERALQLRRARGDAFVMAANVGATVAGGDWLAPNHAAAGAVAARYALKRELGRGATGVVYEARDRELQRDVAVKLLHPHLAAADRAQACARFFAEARTAASLRHPNIMAVLDIEESARRIVLELAAGGTLRQVLRDSGPRPVRRAIERHAQILSALTASHRRGVVHRDIKPGNLMFRRDSDAPGAEIMLGDFGVAHLPDAAGATGARAAEARKPAEAVGTLAYMSPEQRRGADADPRSDLYAAAVVLYEMLTGRPPWSREILLAGVRKPGDFRLPEDVIARAPAAIVESLQQHLDHLGCPEPEGRPDTETATKDARRLREMVIVYGEQLGNVG